MQKYRVVVGNKKKYYINVTNYSILDYIIDSISTIKKNREAYLIYYDNKLNNSSMVGFSIGLGLALIMIFFSERISISVELFYVFTLISCLIVYLMFKKSYQKKENELKFYLNKKMAKKIYLQIAVKDKKKNFLILLFYFSVIILSLLFVYLTFRNNDYIHSLVFLTAFWSFLNAYKLISPGPMVAEYIEM